MPSIGSSILPASALLTDPKIANYDMPDADTVYEIELPLGTRQFSLKPRSIATLKIRDAMAGVPYYTLSKGEGYEVSGIKGHSDETTKLYIESSSPSQVLEVFYWL